MRVYQDLIKGLMSLEIDLFPSNYGFVRYFPPLDDLPKVQTNKDREIGFENITGKLALFVYIPFCTGKCSYCFYLKKVNAPRKEVNEYLECLKKEAEISSKRINGHRISSVYVGGGTPTYLDAEQLKGLFRIMNSAFDILIDDSFTFEASPETLDKEKINILLDNSVKRISMGIQSLDDKILASIERRYTSKEAIKKIMLLKKNAPSFNLDFIYGLKNQTTLDVMNYLDLIKEIQPPSVTFYQKWFFMKDEFGTRSQKIKKGESLFGIIAKKELIAETMESLGYLRDGLYRYVKKSADGCAYCKTVWGDNSCLALGLSAYSYINGVGFQNSKSFAEYQKLLNQNVLPITRKKILTNEERAIRALVMGLKANGTKSCGVSITEIEQRYEVKLTPETEKFINELVSIKALTVENQRLFFTQQGSTFAENILLNLTERQCFSGLD